MLDALHLVWDVFAQDVAPLYTPEGVASFQDFIRYPNIERKMQTEGLALFGAFEGSQLLGVGGILPTGHIALLFVRREYQHSGIGKAILLEMCSFAVQTYRVSKFTVNASPGAVDAYRHMGMHDTAPEQNAGGMRYIPMEMWAASVPPEEKEGKGSLHCRRRGRSLPCSRCGGGSCHLEGAALRGRERRGRVYAGR